MKTYDNIFGLTVRINSPTNTVVTVSHSINKLKRTYLMHLGQSWGRQIRRWVGRWCHARSWMVKWHWSRFEGSAGLHTWVQARWIPRRVIDHGWLHRCFRTRLFVLFVAQLRTMRRQQSVSGVIANAHRWQSTYFWWRVRQYCKRGWLRICWFTRCIQPRMCLGSNSLGFSRKFSTNNCQLCSRSCNFVRRRICRGIHHFVLSI